MKNFSYRQVVLLLLAVFVSGAVVGGFGISLYQAKTVSATTRSTQSPSPKAWREKYVSELTNRLKLNGDQASKLNVILDDTKAQYDAARLRQKPEMDQIHDEQVRNIRAMLDANQAPAYDQYREERDRERRKAQQQKEQEQKKQ